MSEPAPAADFEYRKVLVIGTKKTGKTSILSTAVGGDFSRAYRPTARCAHFYDVQHMLELIDTPGLDDALLNGTKDEVEPSSFEEVRQHYQNFRDDPIVQELLTEPRERSYKDNLLIDVDITQVDAYLIVYTDDERSKRVAKALRLAILTKRIHDSRRAIFMLYHQGDFDSPPFLTRVTINDETRQLDEEKNDPFVELVFRDDVLIQTKAYHHPALKYLPNCSAQTGEGVTRTLGVLRQEIDRMSAKGNAGAGGAGSVAAAGHGVGGAPTKVRSPGTRRVPPDLFALVGEGEPLVGELKLSSGSAAAATAAAEKKSQLPGAGRKVAPRKKAYDDDEGAPVSSKGQQRAQCTSMAAAACAIQ